jgi:hypothetical protein
MVKYVQLLYSKNNLCNEIYLQLQFAAILSCIYAIVMVIAMIGVVRNAIQDGFCSMRIKWRQTVAVNRFHYINYFWNIVTAHI